jgi:beta-lysine N6-acetyltransferase
MKETRVTMDSISKIGDSYIQHGKHNDRVYLIKLSQTDFPAIIDDLGKLADESYYSKIFAKVPDYAKETFEQNGYVVEAVIPTFFGGKDPVYFMSKFLSEYRRAPRNNERRASILKCCEEIEVVSDASIPLEYELLECGVNDVDEMAILYNQIFASYPFPIDNVDYLKKCLDNDVVFFGIRHKGELVALCSAEMDTKAQTAEMTDFATLTKHRGKGLASKLLAFMEQNIAKRSIRTAYTIARAPSAGINCVFAKAGYRYAGTLINNTQIAGHIESMNVWYKNL